MIKSRTLFIILSLTVIAFLGSHHYNSLHKEDIISSDGMGFEVSHTSDVKPDQESSQKSEAPTSKKTDNGVKAKVTKEDLAVCAALHECGIQNCEDTTDQDELIICLNKLSFAGNLCLIDGESVHYSALNTECKKQSQEKPFNLEQKGDIGHPQINNSIQSQEQGNGQKAIIVDTSVGAKGEGQKNDITNSTKNAKSEDEKKDIDAKAGEKEQVNQGETKDSSPKIDGAKSAESNSTKKPESESEDQKNSIIKNSVESKGDNQKNNITLSAQDSQNEDEEKKKLDTSTKNVEAGKQNNPTQQDSNPDQTGENQKKDISDQSIGAKGDIQKGEISGEAQAAKKGEEKTQIVSNAEESSEDNGKVDTSTKNIGAVKEQHPATPKSVKDSSLTLNQQGSSLNLRGDSHNFKILDPTTESFEESG